MERRGAATTLIPADARGDEELAPAVEDGGVGALRPEFLTEEGGMAAISGRGLRGCLAASQIPKKFRERPKDAAKKMG